MMDRPRGPRCEGQGCFNRLQPGEEVLCNRCKRRINRGLPDAWFADPAAPPAPPRRLPRFRQRA